MLLSLLLEVDKPLSVVFGKGVLNVEEQLVWMILWKPGTMP